MVEWDGLMIQDGAFQDFVHPSLGVPDDEDEDLIDKFHQLNLEIDGGAYQTRVFLEVME